MINFINHNQCVCVWKSIKKWFANHEYTWNIWIVMLSRCFFLKQIIKIIFGIFLHISCALACTWTCNFCKPICKLWFFQVALSLKNGSLKVMIKFMIKWIFFDLKLMWLASNLSSNKNLRKSCFRATFNEVSKKIEQFLKRLIILSGLWSVWRIDYRIVQNQVELLSCVFGTFEYISNKNQLENLFSAVKVESKCFVVVLIWWGLDQYIERHFRDWNWVKRKTS